MAVIVCCSLALVVSARLSEENHVMPDAGPHPDEARLLGEGNAAASLLAAFLPLPVAPGDGVLVPLRLPLVVFLTASFGNAATPVLPPPLFLAAFKAPPVLPPAALAAGSDTDAGLAAPPLLFRAPGHDGAAPPAVLRAVSLVVPGGPTPLPPTAGCVARLDSPPASAAATAAFPSVGAALPFELLGLLPAPAEIGTLRPSAFGRLPPLLFRATCCRNNLWRCRSPCGPACAASDVAAATTAAAVASAAVVSAAARSSPADGSGARSRAIRLAVGRAPLLPGCDAVRLPMMVACSASSPLVSAAEGIRVRSCCLKAAVPLLLSDAASRSAKCFGCHVSPLIAVVAGELVLSLSTSDSAAVPAASTPLLSMG